MTLLSTPCTAGGAGELNSYRPEPRIRTPYTVNSRPMKNQMEMKCLCSAIRFPILTACRKNRGQTKLSLGDHSGIREISAPAVDSSVRSRLLPQAPNARMPHFSRKIILLALVLFVPACNRQQKRIIGVVPQGQSHLFWQSIHAGAVAAARETGVDIQWNGPPNERDFNGQLKIIDAMINRRVDAIALSPSDTNAFVGVVERAVHEKIPVIIFDTGINTEVYTARVATDNYGAGRLAAKRMGEILGGKGKIVIVAVAPGIASTMAREQGFEDVMKKDFPNIEI